MALTRKIPIKALDVGGDIFTLYKEEPNRLDGLLSLVLLARSREIVFRFSVGSNQALKLSQPYASLSAATEAFDTAIANARQKLAPGVETGSDESP